MNTYTAYFYTDANYVSEEIKADKPEQALAVARAWVDDEKIQYFHPYDEASPVNHIEILDAHRNHLAIISHRG
jgi:hypothetical protein